MAELSFVAAERRLVVRGPCSKSDCDPIVEAIEVFAGLVDRLTLDLTEATGLPLDVAASILRACRNAERVGYQVAVQTVAGSSGSTWPPDRDGPRSAATTVERG
jgi:hypothetical protein